MEDSLPAEIATKVVVLPDLAHAWLKSGDANLGRVWLILKTLDTDNCGWLSVRKTETVLTEKSSPLRIFGKRQFRKLLQYGNQRFWTRDKTRIWLRSALRVAQAYEITRFQADAVAICPKPLFESVSSARAVLYSTIYADKDAPISRATLSDLTEISPNSQRSYEKRVNIKVERNYALVSQQQDGQDGKEARWKLGRASFTVFYKGNRWLARQLPNRYTTSIARPLPKRKRRLNKALRDLSNQGTTGNAQIKSRLYATKQSTNHVAFTPLTRANWWLASA